MLAGSGLAARVATAVRRRGVDVFDYGNAPNFDYGETMLVGRRPNDQLESLGEMLGCDNVIEQFRDGSPVDATLIIGADYERLNLDLEADSTLPR